MKAIIFDFDGVIVDTYENHYQTLAKKYKNFDRETHKKLFEGNALILKESLEIKNPNIDVSSLLKEHLLQVEISKKILDVLKKLKKDYYLFIVSSHKESILREFFHNKNLHNLFNEILGSETHKKKSVKFNVLFKKYNLSKKDCLFVTDTLGDILEANKVGIKSVGVDFGFHEKERLAKGKPLEIISNFNQLLEIIKSLCN